MLKKIIIKKKIKSKESPSLFSPPCFPLSPQTPSQIERSWQSSRGRETKQMGMKRKKR